MYHLFSFNLVKQVIMFIYRATSQSQVITVSTGRAKSDEALHTSREGRSDLNTVKTVTMSFHRTRLTKMNERLNKERR